MTSTVNRDGRTKHDEDTMRKGVVAFIHILRLELQGVYYQGPSADQLSHMERKCGLLSW